MMHSATEATTQDARLSIEEEGDCNIKEEPGGRSFLQRGPDLTTHGPRKAALLVALRQNARNYAGRKFPSRRHAQDEIDRRALRCKVLLGFCGFASRPVRL
jgi:hypothetical protein